MPKTTTYTAACRIEFATGTVHRGDVLTAAELAAAGQDDHCIGNLLADGALVEGDQAAQLARDQRAEELRAHRAAVEAELAALENDPAATGSQSVSASDRASAKAKRA